MRDLQTALASLDSWIDYPNQPDLVAGVDAAIKSRRRQPLSWLRRPAMASVAAAAAVVILIIGLVPAAREQVASWLGIGGVTIETVVPPVTQAPPVTSVPAVTEPSTTQPRATVPPAVGVVESGLGAGLALGTETTIAESAELVGFDPLLPIGLDPDRVFHDEGGRLWMLFAAGSDLPETAASDVGMIVTQFSSDDTPGIVKQVAPGDFDLLEIDGEVGLWVPGPHELFVTEADGSAVSGRSVGNTLLWEQGDLTLRIESNLSLEQAVVIASSFE